MKKIVSLLLICVFVFMNLFFVGVNCYANLPGDNTPPPNGDEVIPDDGGGDEQEEEEEEETFRYETFATEKNMGIDCGPKKLTNGQCKLDIYGVLGIKKEQNPSPDVFVQDIIWTSTMFIGTVVVVAMIVSGLMYVFAGADTSLKQRAGRGFMYALIGMFVVMASYTIIRLVQYIIGA